MLHPNQFEVNEAWLAFRVSTVPVRTERDGDFNCVALLDLASCFILGTEFIPVGDLEPSQAHSRSLLKKGQSHKQQLPTTLFIPSEDAADFLVQEAGRQKIQVLRVPEIELVVFTGEVRQGFAERFGG
jgi:hypothetical protein